MIADRLCNDDAPSLVPIIVVHKMATNQTTWRGTQTQTRRVSVRHSQVEEANKAKTTPNIIALKVTISVQCETLWHQSFDQA